MNFFLSTLFILLSFTVQAGGILPMAGFSQPSTLKVKQISTGMDFNCALLEDGSLKCWGKNDNGELGQKTAILVPNADPAQIVWDHMGDVAGEMEKLPSINFGVGKKVLQVSAGGDSTCAIMENSRIKCWGNNSVGQLGYGDTDNRGMTDAEMLALPDVDLGDDSGRPYTALQVSQGSNHTCAILDNSKIKCWGYNNFGMLGIENNDIHGDVPGTMGNNLPFVNLGTDGGGRELKAVQIVAGFALTCALLDDSSVKCWGANFSGQLGEGDTNWKGDGVGEMGNGRPAINLGTGLKARQISTNGEFVCALLNNGQIKCWGNNGNYQVKTGNNTNHIGDQANEMGDNLVALNLGTNVKAIQVAASSDHVCALIDDGGVKCWGYNGYGQLGKGHTNIIGSSAAQMGDNLLPIDLGTNKKAIQISASAYNSCALLSDGSHKCWGVNNMGQLGKGNTSSIGVSAGQMGDSLLPIKMGKRTSRLLRVAGTKAKISHAHQGIKTVESTTNHACAILENLKLKCWGLSGWGELGYSNTTSKGDVAGTMGNALLEVDLGTNAIVKMVAIGQSHTCALMGDSQIKCWGRNTAGALGYGDNTQRGHTTGTMGAALTNINLGANVKALQVTAGYDSSCALLDDSTVKCWGLNSYGQLGQTTSADTNSIPASAIVLGEKVLSISSGVYSNCAILFSGNVKCWGRNNMGQLGQNNTSNYGFTGYAMSSLGNINLGTGRTALSIVIGDEHACAILDNSSVKCWGSNSSGQLGLGTSVAKVGNAAGDMTGLATVNLGSRKAKQLALGTLHTCVLTEIGTVLCWGSNSNGQLGVGNTTSKGTAAADMGTNLVAVDFGAGRFATQISAGLQHTCAVLDDSSVKCWGNGIYGSLGQNGTADIGKTSANEISLLMPINLGTGK
ncbi:hypothetical protein SHI21_14070 [Bacteriovorax sp. PP10]|uniref:RCC1 repeat-containing protein n=1 Tax=Bacteriovorax antarcticus TaxID=3088717 RepID=A0ABU5VWB5_9BACT|nr:hypothetical protein [Bacteriovorax sp. PP10]MEA9357348.1 hypothetical protein [Bacteriovorax sp. PP10]